MSVDLHQARYMSRIPFNLSSFNLKKSDYLSNVICYETYKNHMILFELTNRPVTFQHFINEILMRYLNGFITAFMDGLPHLYFKNKSECLI